MDTPPGLAKLEDFCDLNDRGRFNFMARLNYIEEIVGTIGAWVRAGDDGEDLDAFLDDLELDVAACHGQDLGEPETFESVWMVHTTWLTAHPRARLRAALPPDLLAACAADDVAIDTSRAAITAWLHGCATALGTALETLRSAREPVRVAAVLVVLNILMARLTTGLYRLRLRPDEPAFP